MMFSNWATGPVILQKQFQTSSIKWLSKPCDICAQWKRPWTCVQNTFSLWIRRLLNISYNTLNHGLRTHRSWFGSSTAHFLESKDFGPLRYHQVTGGETSKGHAANVRRALRRQGHCCSALFAPEQRRKKRPEAIESQWVHWGCKPQEELGLNGIATENRTLGDSLEEIRRRFVQIQGWHSFMATTCLPVTAVC